MNAPRPLAGLRVVELGQVLAAPFAGMVFADLGAKVIKVEKPGGGDDARRMGPAYRGGDALTFHTFNRGKRSVVLDLGADADRATFFALLEDADVFVHNLRPDVIERFGIGPAELTARFGRLVYCELSAFGHKGPKRLDPGYEPLVQAFSGLSSINGFADRPPVRTGPSVCDIGSGMWVVIGALAALRERDRTGRGSVVSAALLETALTFANNAVDGLVNEGHSPGRHGTGHPNLVPYQTFATADGDVMIAAGNDRLFGKLAAVLGCAGLADDPEYRSNRDRLRNRDALIARLSAVLVTHDRTHWLDALAAAGVPCSPVHDIAQALDHEQVRALDQSRPVPGSELRLLGLPLHFDGARPEPAGPTPRLEG